MGPKLGRPRDGNSKVGKGTECPMCGDDLPASTTYDQVNQHIDHCMQNPVMAEEKKRVKKLQSKFIWQSLFVFFPDVKK